MAVSNQIPRNVSVATPGATVFPYNFKVTRASDLLVRVNGVTKSLGVHYTVDGVGQDSGGNITFLTPMAGGESVMRRRNMEFTRGTDYQNLGDLRSATLNNDQDEPILMIQQIGEQVSRAVTLQEDIEGVDPTLPLPDPSKLIGWNAAGTGLRNNDLSGPGDLTLRSDLADPTGGAALVRYDAARTVDQKLRNDLPTVLDNALADPDGIEDSSDAIEQWILSPGSKVRKIGRKGVYRLTRNLYFGPDDVSDLELDFEGSTILFEGIRTVGGDVQEYGAITFFGDVTEDYYDQVLASDAVEGDVYYSVSDTSFFERGSYYWIQVNPASSVQADHIVDLMAECTRVDSGAGRVYFNHRRGYAVPSGQTVRFRKVRPIRNVTVKNLTIINNVPYDGTPTAKSQASSGVTFNYTVGCELENFRMVNSAKRATQWQYCMRGQLTDVATIDPIEVVAGGYTAGFYSCLFIEANRLHSVRDRHVADVTGGAHVTFRSCQEGETTNSTFTTHGKWEHNIIFDGCSGHLQIAGSGAPFGERARNIIARGHHGNQLIARAGVTDLTVEDSKFYSIADLNCDGLQIRGSQFFNQVTFKKATSLSRRPNTISDAMLTLGGTPAFDVGVDAEVFFERVTIPTLFNNSLTAYGKFRFTDCNVRTESTSGAGVSCGAEVLEVRGGYWYGCNLVLSGTSDQTIRFLDGVEVSSHNRPSSLAIINSTKTGGTLRLDVKNIRSITPEGARHLTAITTGATLRITYIGNEITGGTFRVDSDAINVANGGHLLLNNNQWRGVTKTLPAAGVGIVYGDGEVDV